MILSFLLHLEDAALQGSIPKPFSEPRTVHENFVVVVMNAWSALEIGRPLEILTVAPSR
jgi:hypothetical protein